MSGPVHYELAEGVATLTLDDGKVNAFSIATLRALHAALDEAEGAQAAVLLQGREGCFSAGFDLEVFAGGDVEQVLEMLRLGATLAERILAFRRPVVLASTGHTVAAGAFLLLAADLRVGADGPFRIGLNEVQIGLTVPWFVIELARQRLTPAHCSRALALATIFDPREAVVAGFLDRVVAPAELHAAAREEAARLAVLNAAAHAATKLRARHDALAAIRRAIETELTAEGLGGSSPPR